jgi:hypothetical protein
VFIASVETANARRSLAARFLYGSVTVATFFWFWYGDMYIIRGLMAAAVLLPVYSGWLQMTPNVGRGSPGRVTGSRTRMN